MEPAERAHLRPDGIWCWMEYQRRGTSETNWPGSWLRSPPPRYRGGHTLERAKAIVSGDAGWALFRRARQTVAQVQSGLAEDERTVLVRALMDALRGGDLEALMDVQAAFRRLEKHWASVGPCGGPTDRRITTATWRATPRS